MSAAEAMRAGATAVAARVLGAGYSDSAYVRGLQAGRIEARTDIAHARAVAYREGRDDGYGRGYEKALADLKDQQRWAIKLETWAVAAMVVAVLIMLGAAWFAPGGCL